LTYFISPSAADSDDPKSTLSSSPILTHKIKELTMPRQIPSLNLVDARALIAAGEKKAKQLGVPYNIAVVDAGGGLVDQDLEVAKAAASVFAPRH
jgi:uncharacterized protein GlcG (DUF336 family)